VCGKEEEGELKAEVKELKKMLVPCDQLDA
jgi:hypothetical protein